MSHHIENAFIVLAGISIKYGYVDKALVYCNAARRLFPDSVDISELLALSMLHADQPEQALAELERWERVTPNMHYIAIKSRMLLGDMTAVKSNVTGYLGSYRAI